MDEELDQEQPSQHTSSAFPPPPPFYKHFTEANRSKLETFKKEALEKSANKEGNVSTSELRLLELPPELRYLVPPEPPKEGKYTIFGDTFDVGA